MSLILFPGLVRGRLKIRLPGLPDPDRAFESERGRGGDGERKRRSEEL
jgi:hypothetical protein